MRDTSVGSSFQVNSAMVRNTCRRLCHVQVPVPSAFRQQGLAELGYFVVGRDLARVDPKDRLSGHAYIGWG